MNRLLTPEEAAREWLDAFNELGVSLTPKERRALIYDLQTSLGGFPASEEERRKYIEKE